jgi:esterase/lipase superfamily enzyme
MKNEAIRRVLARVMDAIDSVIAGNRALSIAIMVRLSQARERLLETYDSLQGIDDDLLADNALEEIAAQEQRLDAWHVADFDAEKLLDLVEDVADVASGAVVQMSGAFGIESFGVSFEEEPEANYSIVKVFYSTDRDALRDEEGKLAFGPGRSQSGVLQYGECAISIPKVHRVGGLESPSIWRLEFRPDPNKHVVLLETESLEEKAYFDLVAASVGRSPSKEAFVFIHGYNVSFENAARRAGQLAFDLEFEGAPIFYSWPSNGRTADYPRDEADVAWSAPHFERFLTLLGQRAGAERIHIIAHSMGNRAVCEALKGISRNPIAGVNFQHVVLAAPDVDAETFAELAVALKQVAHRVTLYASSNDKALRLSKVLHGNPRAGEAGEGLLILPHIDTIDASDISTDFLAHSYFGDRWPLLADIQMMLAEDKPPASRFGLLELVRAAGTYYRFKAD